MIIDSSFQTPIAVCEYMASLVPSEAKTIIEPTPGLGNLVAVLEAKGFDVFAVDDFFQMDFKSQCDCIVMNPPFSTKSAFIEHAAAGIDLSGMKIGYFILQKCMEMSNNVIALMPWFALTDSDVRMRFIMNYGVKSLTALPRKTFQYARIQTVIIELEKGYTGDTIFKHFQF